MNQTKINEFLDFQIGNRLISSDPEVRKSLSEAMMIIDEKDWDKFLDFYSPYYPKIEWLKTIICGGLTIDLVSRAVILRQHSTDKNRKKLKLQLNIIYLIVYLIAIVLMFMGIRTTSLIIYFSWNLVSAIGITNSARYLNGMMILVLIKDLKKGEKTK